MATRNDLPPILPIAVILFLILLAGFIPTLYSQTQGEQTTSLTLNAGETKSIKPPLQTTVTNMTTISINNESRKVVNVSIIDYETGQTAHTGLLNFSETSTLSLSNEDISVNWLINTGSQTAMISYTYPSTYGMGSIQTSLLQTMGVILLIVFVYIISRVITIGGDE